MRNEFGGRSPNAEVIQNPNAASSEAGTLPGQRRRRVRSLGVVDAGTHRPTRDR